MGLGLADHLVDVVLRQHRGGRDPDLLLLGCRAVLRLHVEDAVRVDVEGHLDLRDAPRRRRDPVEDEAAERLVVVREVALALEDVDLDLALVVRRRGEDLRLAGRDGRVAVDQPGHDPAERLDAQGQRRHVEEEDVLHLAAENPGLDRGADRHDLVRVHALVGLLAEQALDHLLDRGHAGHAADEDHLVDLARLEPGVLDGRQDRALGLLDQVADQVLELRAGQVDHQVLRPGGVGGDVGQVDLGRRRRGQLDLRLLGGLLEALEGLLVLRQVDALVLLELRQQPVDDALVEVVAAQVRVAIRGLDLEHALAQLQDRDVEGAATQVVDRDLLVVLLVQAVGQGRGRGLVDDPLDLEARDPPGVLGRLALGVVEVGGDRDDRLGDLLAQVRLGVGLQLLEDHCADLGRRVVAVAGNDADPVGLGVLLDVVRDETLGALHLGVVPAAAHEALDRVDGVGRVGDRLALGQLADHALAGLGESDDRRNGAVAL